MLSTEKIKTIIIDDDKNFLFDLREHLNFFPEIEVISYALTYKKAKDLLLNSDPDLVFLDIEMPVKNGFELLNEVRESGKNNFDVIFYTAYDSYMIDAIRHAALDYIIKPLKADELKNAIERHKSKEKVKYKETLTSGLVFPEMVSLPVPTGMKFIDKRNIILFQCNKSSLFEKSCWEALLSDGTKLKLRTNLNASQLKNFLGNSRCAHINQSTIVNLQYLCLVEFKTRECFLIPPFNNIKLVASRNCLSALKEKFYTLG